MISIRIDVYKDRCIVSKPESKKNLEQSSLDNITQGVTDFTKHIKETCGIICRRFVSQLQTIGLDCVAWIE